ncbi:uncharacterized protein LOC142334215 [Lycorma delicatula]|uniref:uncharacterized protein LOC142334215 n=1 Tax=Lycorma delicatula TaxID=130591 RepID=UPI003F513D49
MVDSSDISPSMAEFLEKEKMCFDEHKNTDVDSTSTVKVGTISAQDRSNSSSDEEIGNLLQQMKQLLSPRDLEYLKANEGKDVEELLKETEEFINRSSPLFRNLSTHSSCTENSCGVLTSPKNMDEEIDDGNVIIHEMENAAITASSIINHLTCSVQNTDTKLVDESSSVIADNNNTIKQVISADDRLKVSDNKADVVGISPTDDHTVIKRDYEEAEVDEEESDSNGSHFEKINDDGFDNDDGIVEDGGSDVNNDEVEDVEDLISNGSTHEKLSKDDFDNTDKQNINLLYQRNDHSLISVNESNNNFSVADRFLNINATEHLSLSDLEIPIGVDVLSNNLAQNSIQSTNNINTSNGNNNYSCNSNNNINNVGTDSNLLKLQFALEEANKKYKLELEKLQKKYEEEILQLKEHISALNAKLAVYELQVPVTGTGARGNRKILASHEDQMKELKVEIERQEQLIAGYERENQKLFQDMSASKEIWKKEKAELEEKVRAVFKIDSKNIALQDKLKDAQEANVRYQLELESYKELWSKEKMELEEKLRIASTLDNKNLILQDQLKDAQETIVRYQLEMENYKMEKMNNELMKWQKDNEEFSKQPDLNLEIDSLKVTVTQLQAALNVERTQKKNLSRDKDLLLRENMDLKRQVREVEGIIKRRNQSDSTIGKVVGESRLKELEKELQARQVALSSLQNQLEDMQVKYNDHIIELEQRLKSSQEENHTLKQRINELRLKDGDIGQANKRILPSGNSSRPGVNTSGAGPSGGSGSNKEDAHLLATIRGMKLELSKKDKDIIKLNKELEDARKTNRRLQREREKQLKTAAPQKPSSLPANMIKVDNKTASIGDSADIPYERPYNQAVYEEEQEEAIALLKMENKSLSEEIQRLGQDIVTLHGKRIQDLRTLQAEHEQEIQRLLNDYSNRHSQSTVAELQGQIYTHQMVITHLKEQLKQLTELKEENAMLKLERDHLEKALMGTNKRIQELQTPESQQYQSLLEKFESLEQRHEVREQKLQAIVRDLLARSSEPVPCGPVCRNKLLDKNREICYYRVEMDRILEALREFRRSK